MEPPDELPAAAEEAELPVAERPDVDYKSVMVDGVKLDSNTPLRALRGACESLGPWTLQNWWKGNMFGAFVATSRKSRASCCSFCRDLRGDVSRPVHGQPVPAEPSDAEKAEHYLTYLLSGVNFVLQIDHNKMVAVFVLILVMQVEGMMMTNCALYLFMTGVQGLCMWYQRHKREADTSTICALNFVVSSFGVAMIQ